MSERGLQEPSAKRIWELETLDDLNRVLETGTVVLYKHSTACWISSMTWNHIRRFAKKSPEVNIGVVRVIEERAISNAIAERFGIRHESPQAILVEDGEPIWHASHLKISAAALLKAIDSG